MNSFQEIKNMLEGGGSYLFVPPIGCPCLVEGLIMVVPSNTSMITNQHICIR